MEPVQAPQHCKLAIASTTNGAISFISLAFVGSNSDVDQTFRFPNNARGQTWRFQNGGERFHNKRCAKLNLRHMRSLNEKMAMAENWLKLQQCVSYLRLTCYVCTSVYLLHVVKTFVHSAARPRMNMVIQQNCCAPRLGPSWKCPSCTIGIRAEVAMFCQKGATRAHLQNMLSVVHFTENSIIPLRGAQQW